MDTTSEIRLQAVNPTLAAKIRSLDAEFQRQTDGDHLEVVQGYRSLLQQAALYAQGRTAPGKIVTDSPPGHSWHEFGLAVDVVPRSLLPIPGWNPESPLWAQIDQIAQTMGFDTEDCGGCWQHEDRPHLELRGRFPVSPDDEARAILSQGGVQAVWDAAQITE